jgi:hypothetical protein
MFEGNATACLGEATFRGSPSRVGSSPYPHERQTRLGRLARDEHSSLLGKLVKYGQKKFYNIGPLMGSLRMESESLSAEKVKDKIT